LNSNFVVNAPVFTSSPTPFTMTRTSYGGIGVNVFGSLTAEMATLEEQARPNTNLATYSTRFFLRKERDILGRVFQRPTSPNGKS
jgi:hypothetical protein